MECIDVSITDDGALEAVEDFTVMLTAVTSGVTLGNAITTISITDNDGQE